MDFLTVLIRFIRPASWKEINKHFIKMLQTGLAQFQGSSVQLDSMGPTLVLTFETSTAINDSGQDRAN